MNTTIKPTYLFIGAALFLSACSRDDIPGRVEGEGARIVFRTSLPGLTSRAGIITKENLPYFHVTAFDPADGSKVVGGTLQSNFAYEKIEITEGEDIHTSPDCIWPDPGKESHTVTFFGFYPALEKAGGAQLLNASTASAFDYKLSGFRVEPEIADQVDFVTAYATGSMEENLFSGITLPFAHQLSRIEVKAWSDHKSCDIEIAGVRIGGINMKGTFNFRTDNSCGLWSDFSDKGIVEYVFREGDKIVSLVKGSASTSTDKGAVSIMGSKVNGNDNCAMLIPTNYATGWNAEADRNNADKNMYISVLLRITDATTPAAGLNPAEKQRYPYKDLSQGANALNIPVVYLAVDKATGTVSKRVYKSGDSYFTDAAATDRYNIPESEEIKEFGWAAVPVTGNWAPGNTYTYTLNYTYGVGLHDPEVAASATSPNAGDPIISDKVGISYTVKEWNSGGGAGVTVPGS